MKLLRRLLSRHRRARAKALVARYTASAQSYSAMAQFPVAGKPISFVEYCRIMEFVYNSHAEDVRRLL